MSIQFVETDALKIAEEAIGRYEAYADETLYPGDEKYLFLLTIVQILAAARNDINDTGRQNLLRYARGPVLDALGAFYDCPRLQAEKAAAALRFTLSDIHSFNVTIPAATRATPDGQLYFATDVARIITAGQSYADIPATALETGTKYNGFGAGQVKVLVDPIPYVASVTNTGLTGGGTEAEADDDYRERIRLAAKARSNAGPSGAYEYLALSADSGIGSVKVTSPSAGVVMLTLLMKDGSLPDQVVIDKVLAACSHKTVRPLTDNVQAQGPETVSYDIALTYYIGRDREAEETAIREAVEAVGGVVDQYETWQHGGIGRGINPDELRGRMLQAGVCRIDLSAPAYTAVSDTQVAVRGDRSIVYGGLIG